LQHSQLRLAAAAHDCATCECCAGARLLLRREIDAAKEEQAAAVQARRKLEAAVSRAERDRADFEQFKV
jgi:hypothetical protein